MFTHGRLITVGLLLVLAFLVVTAIGGAATAAAPPTASPQPAVAGRGGGGGGAAGGGGRSAQATGDGAHADGQGQGRAGGAGRGEGAGGGGGNGLGAGQARASASPGAANPNVNGEVDIIERRTNTVATKTGWRKVVVPDAARIQTERKGATGDLVPGVHVGVTGKPDGTAVSVRLFPPGIVPKPSQFPMAGARTGNVMTNASIVSFDGKPLVVDLGGKRRRSRCRRGHRSSSRRHPHSRT